MRLLENIALHTHSIVMLVSMTFEGLFNKSVRMESRFVQRQHKIHIKYYNLIHKAAGSSFTKNITGEHPCPTLAELAKMELDQAFELANVTMSYLEYTTSHSDKRGTEVAFEAIEHDMAKLQKCITLAQEHDIPIEHYYEKYPWARLLFAA